MSKSTARLAAGLTVVLTVFLLVFDLVYKWLLDLLKPYMAPIILSVPGPIIVAQAFSGLCVVLLAFVVVGVFIFALSAMLEALIGPYDSKSDVRAIVTMYSGAARRVPKEVSGDAEHMKIVAVDSYGGETTIFSGDAFDEAEYAWRCDERDINSQAWTGEQ